MKNYYGVMEYSTSMTPTKCYNVVKAFVVKNVFFVCKQRQRNTVMTLLLRVQEGAKWRHKNFPFKANVGMLHPVSARSVFIKRRYSLAITNRNSGFGLVGVKRLLWT